MKPDNLVFFGPVMKIVDLGIAQKEAFGYDRSPSVSFSTSLIIVFV